MMGVSTASGLVRLGGGGGMISVAFDPLPQQLVKENSVCGKPAPASPTGEEKETRDRLRCCFPPSRVQPRPHIPGLSLIGQAEGCAALIG